MQPCTNEVAKRFYGGLHGRKPQLEDPFLLSWTPKQAQNCGNPSFEQFLLIQALFPEHFLGKRRNSSRNQLPWDLDTLERVSCAARAHTLRVAGGGAGNYSSCAVRATNACLVEAKQTCTCLTRFGILGAVCNPQPRAQFPATRGVQVPCYFFGGVLIFCRGVFAMALEAPRADCNSTFGRPKMGSQTKGTPHVVSPPPCAAMPKRGARIYCFANVPSPKPIPTHSRQSTPAAFSVNRCSWSNEFCVYLLGIFRSIIVVTWDGLTTQSRSNIRQVRSKWGGGGGITTRETTESICRKDDTPTQLTSGVKMKPSLLVADGGLDWRKSTYPLAAFVLSFLESMCQKVLAAMES